MPTSRATRVTSSANDRSWSTIVLIVFLSSRISPLTSTVIFWLRSPLATAVVTWAMLRTWSVRFEAMKFTESVRSFQVPATPGTCAWPPSLPSVPTSRATRVTSSAKLESWSTIEFTVVPMRANSPLTGRPSISSAIFWFRSPSATATITRATSVVGRTRSSIRPLTESTAVLHPPVAPCSRARSVMRPSRPMISADADELGLERGVARGHLVVGGLEPADVVLAPRRQADAEVAGGRGVQGVLEPGQARIVHVRAAVLSRGRGAVRALARRVRLYRT